jgi:hypothetical protein
VSVSRSGPGVAAQRARTRTHRRHAASAGI